MEVIAFYILSSLIISMLLIVVTTKQPVYAMSALAAGLTLISGIFFLLDAEFLGVVQIAVYTGGIMALYAFGFMFFDTAKDIKEKVKSKNLIYLLSILSSVLTLIIVLLPIYTKIKPSIPITNHISNAHELGIVLFTRYLLPFELAAILLLVAMIGGIIVVSSKMNYSWSTHTDEQIKRDGEEL